MNNLKPFALTATLALAIAFTFSCSSDNGGNSNGGDPVGSTKDSCIRTELEIKANTLDEAAGACNATRSEVLAQLSSTIGNCNKNDLDFDKPLREILEACNVAEIPVVSSSSGVSSSCVVGSSSSVGGSSSGTSSTGGSSSSTGGSSSSIVIERGTVEYEGYTYKTVKIGTQWWFAENLRYNAEGSVCYAEGQLNCNSYGRLYDWNTAMNNSATSTSNPSGVRGICPDGWHLPSHSEWTELTDYVGSNAGMKLKKGCFYDEDDDLCGSDEFGFSALSSGYGNSSGWNYIGERGYWWTATDIDENRAMYRSVSYNSSNVTSSYLSKTSLLSVRCVKN